MLKKSAIGAKLFVFVSSLFLGVAAVNAADSPWLGVVIEDLSGEALEKLDHGVLIRQVLPGSAAEQASLKSGDLLSAFDRRVVDSVERLQWLVSQKQVGDEVMLEAYRDGQPMTFNATLGAAVNDKVAGHYGQYMGHHQGKHHNKHQQQCKKNGSELNASLQDLNPGLREFFGVEPGVGMLVAAIADGGAAATAGVMVGDVVVRMDRKSIATMKDVKKVLNYFVPGDEIDLVVVRDKQAQVLKLVLAKPDTSSCEMHKRGHHKACDSKNKSHGGHHGEMNEVPAFGPHGMPGHSFTIPAPIMAPPAPH